MTTTKFCRRRHNFLATTLPFLLLLPTPSTPFTMPSKPETSLRHSEFFAKNPSGPSGRDQSNNDRDEEREPSFDLLEYSIDSFLRGDYDRPFAEDAAAPLPDLTPGQTVDQALRSLRQMDDPQPSHGAAVLLRFCTPLRRSERWYPGKKDPWKEILRGALTPTMLSMRLRSSEDFSGLLDWVKLDVTEGAMGGDNDLDGLSTVAFVSAALYFDEGMEPTLIQFRLRRMRGVWLIDTARKSENKLFMEAEDEADTSSTENGDQNTDKET